MKVYNVIQTSNCDGEILVNVTPCTDLHSAQAIMNDEIRTLLSSGKYSGLDLDDLEKRTQDGDENDWEREFNVDRAEDHIYITCNVDNYFEWIDIEEKEIVKKG